MRAPALHKMFEEFDMPGQLRPIKTLKISLNYNHESNGYGFICYEKQEDAQAAIEKFKQTERED